ncbi:unnamed protein product [Trichobilharzia regenti]|nr:unnamed protein product [Trichobilharzia regenti]
MVNHALATEKVEAMFERFYQNEFDDVSVHVLMSIEDRNTPKYHVRVHTRTLGKEWNALCDSIYFRTREFKTRTTRRTLLSYLASIFDPVGIIAPILLSAKLTLQDTCRRRLEWDADLPEDCLAAPNRWYKNINYLHKIRIPRCIMPISCEMLSIRLHCFSDASEFTYGAVV